MKSYAVVQNGDESSIVEYESDRGNYVFSLAEDDEFIIPENPDIRPFVISDLGDFLRLPDLPWYARALRRRMSSAFDSIRREGVSLRFFEVHAEGACENPVSNVAAGWRNFMGQVTRTAVHFNEQTGKPEPNASGIRSLARGFADSGISEDSGIRFIQYVVDVQRSGHATGYMRRHILGWVLPMAESISLIMAYIALGFLLGMDSAVNTFIGDWYALNNGDSYLLLVAVPIVAYAMWKRSR